MTPDLVVVGGGIIGLSCAWQAQQAGMHVQVLDARGPGEGASRRAAGMLLPDIEGEHDPSERDFGRRSYEIYPRFAADVEAAGGQPTGYARCSCCLVAQSPERAQSLRHMEWGAFLEVPALAAELPGIGESFGARRGPAAQVEPRQLVEALASGLRRRGAEIETGLAVTDVRRGPRGVEGVQMADGSMRQAARYLFATGAWAGTMPYLAERGLVTEPVRGEIVTLEDSGDEPLADIIFGQGIYLAPKGGRKVYLGATEERAGFDERPTAGGTLHLLEGLRRLYPAAMRWQVRETWAGLRPYRAGGPLIARIDENAVAAAGHHRNGILLAPATAERVLALLAELQ